MYRNQEAAEKSVTIVTKDLLNTQDLPIMLTRKPQIEFVD